MAADTRTEREPSLLLNLRNEDSSIGLVSQDLSVVVAAPAARTSVAVVVAVVVVVVATVTATESTTVATNATNATSVSRTTTRQL